MAEARPVRVRIPPSPTGNLHVGTARTALFNELFARHHGGLFLLRFEDTDQARSKPEYEKNIMDGLAWLGITWDGEITRQSERTALYTAALEKLLAEDKAYLDGQAVKLKVTSQEIVFTDLVRGEVKTLTDTFGRDFVIARNMTDPLYHLAVVVDDADMQITHVIRGEDHISNTPKHILLQQALGYPQPQYAHLPLLLDESRRKLSKRAADTDVLSYRDQGYLPEAMINYLALLGWNPKTDEEFFTHEELITRFDLSGVQKGGAVFSIEKLNAINKHYLQQLSPNELYRQATPFLPEQNDRVKAALLTEQSRVSTLKELTAAVDFALSTWQPTYAPELLVWKKSDAVKTKQALQQVESFLQTLAETRFMADSLQADIMAWIDANTLDRGETLWPLRVALTGKEHSPSPFEVAAALGKKESLKRVGQALAIL